MAKTNSILPSIVSKHLLDSFFLSIAADNLSISKERVTVFRGLLLRYYKLEDIDRNGTSTMHGRVRVMPRLVYGIGE